MNGLTVFWAILLIAVLIWYTLITIYVSIRGAADIKGMLRELDDRRPRDSND